MKGLMLFSFILMGCASVSKKENAGFPLRDFLLLDVKNETRSSIRKKIGTPDNIVDIPESLFGLKGAKQWEFSVNNHRAKISITFVGESVNTASWDVSVGELEEKVSFMLEKIKANWKILREPHSNPHVTPRECYLRDNSKGIGININGHTKKVESIIKWDIDGPDLKRKYQELSLKPKKACVAGLCSPAVSEKDKWLWNQCEWVEKLVGKSKVK